VKTTQALTVKAYVFNALEAEAGLQNTRVSYGLPGRAEPSPSSVIVGNVKWDKSEWKTNRGREETFRIDVLSEVQILGGSAMDAETEVAMLNGIVEDFFATSPTFGLGNLVISDYSPGALISWPMDETHYAAQVHGELTVTARF